MTGLTERRTNPGLVNHSPTARLDAVSLLTVFLVALMAIPARLTIAPLGGAGAPAQVCALGCLGIWIYYHVQRPDPTGYGIQPVRWAFFAFACAVLASYIAAMTRPIEGAEVSTANLGLASLAGWAGICLMANDGIPDRQRAERLLRRLVFGAGALSTLALFQFFTSTALIDRISIPGMSVNEAYGVLFSRAGFNRPGATALHPLEFASTITMLLPIAITFARIDLTRGRVRRWFPVLVMAFATFTSISRSAIITALVGLVVLAVTWPPLTRLMALISVGGITVLVGLLIPTMLGSILGLFTAIEDDGSAQSRSGSYALASEFIDRHPFFGRGFSTFLPSYRILDNQYLGLLIETGFVGLSAFIALTVTAVVCARRCRRLTSDVFVREVGQALAASVLAGACGLALFDGLGFPMSSSIFFLVVGVTGAYYRLLTVEFSIAGGRDVSAAGAPANSAAPSVDAAG